jgi:hypothetical protein
MGRYGTIGGNEILALQVRDFSACPQFVADLSDCIKFYKNAILDRNIIVTRANVISQI